VGGPVLERERELAALAAAVRDAAAGTGSVVLVSGEAGIGKSSLVEAARGALPAKARLLVGYCDDLATRRTLGPFRDLAGAAGSALARELDGGDRNRLLDALRTELSWTGQPTVLVVEDVHWADEATLDVLRFLVRRVAGLPAVLVLTYRDDELDPGHPLRNLLGLAARAERVRRLPLARLSPDAVRRLTEATAQTDATALDADRLYAVTSGNPFFVTELLAAGDLDKTPQTVLDAVLDRTRAADPATRDALDQLAVIPSTVDRWLVDRLVPGGLAALASAEQRGLVTVTPNRVTFRHELIRRALADALSAARRIALNQRVLAMLLDRDEPDLAAVVHHAAEAGDLAAVARYAPVAAEEASRAGAHQEAAAHLRLALEQRWAYPPAELADLLDRYGIECYTTDQDKPALAAQREAVTLRRSLRDPRRLGESLRWLSRIEWWSGNRGAALRAAREGITVLERTGDVGRLAMAYSSQSQLFAVAAYSREAIELGEQAVRLARKAGDRPTLAHALNNLGVAWWNLLDPRGFTNVQESLRIALSLNHIDHAVRAYVNMIWQLIEDARFAAAERYLTEGMELADCAEHRMALTYMHLELGLLNLATGRWDEAVRAIELAVDAQRPLRCASLVVLALVRIRRGLPGAADLLAEASGLADELRELQRSAPVAAARAETAWLHGDDPGALAALTETHAEAVALEAHQARIPLAYWMWRLGEPPEPVAADHPYALLMRGRWREAARAWQDAGCPYEHAVALAESTESADLMTALAELDALGAEPMARRVRARLREVGVVRLPRRPNEDTRQNPAGLTARQLEVLRLLCAHLTNGEIAQRLVVSVRTVDHHVAAVLTKLDAHSRREAVARAVELGLVPAAET
jgi:DNA-binding CsgD family transcriptional regulator/tetratricopeptide (TPR) repeat protein